MSGLIALDITQQIDLASLKHDPSSSRDRMIIAAYQNIPWALESNTSNTSNTSQVNILTTDRDLLFQILMVENISKSKQSQIDDINAKLNPKNQRVDRLNASKLKRQPQTVISHIDMDNDNTDLPSSLMQSSQNDMFKFTIQGKNSTIFSAITTYPIKWGNCALGAKIIIKKGTLFNKNIFILRNQSNSTFLGGINRIWNENRDLKLNDYLSQKLTRNRATASSQTSRKRKL